MNRIVALLVFTLLLALPAQRATNAMGAGELFDETVPSGANYDKAEFRLWYPANAASLRAIVVLMPGSNGDGRPMAEEPDWQAFATKNRLALVGGRLTDKPHDQSFIEEYANVSMGSGQALLTALSILQHAQNIPNFRLPRFFSGECLRVENSITSLLPGNRNAWPPSS